MTPPSTSTTFISSSSPPKLKAHQSKSSTSVDVPSALQLRKQHTHFLDLMQDEEHDLNAALIERTDTGTDTNQTFKEFATQAHAELLDSYAQHYGSEESTPTYECTPTAQLFIDSAKAMHTATLHAFALFKEQGHTPETDGLIATLSHDYRDMMTLAPPALDSLGKHTSPAAGNHDDEDAAQRRAHIQDILRQIVQGDGFDPNHSLDMELMHAVFSALDIGSIVAKSAGKTSDLYAKISAMINDLIAIANYFNIVYNEIKAELQKHIKEQGQSAPPTFTWDQSIDIDGMKTLADIIGGINKDFYPGNRRYEALPLPPDLKEVGITSPDLPLPATPYLKSLLMERGGHFFISPGIVRKMVDVINSAIMGMTQDDDSGQGQFSMMWGDFATNDGKTSGALQGLSSTISSLSQKSGQSTNLVSIVLNSIMSLVQKLMDMISASGSARDRISSS